MLPHTKLNRFGAGNERPSQKEKIRKKFNCKFFFIFCKYDIKPSTPLEEANHREFFPNLSIHNFGLSEAVIEHLIKSGKSSEAFFNSVWRPDRHLIERLLYRGDHSDEERLRLLISWFDSSIQMQPREALVVCLVFSLALVFGVSSEDEKNSRLVRLNCQSMTIETLSEVLFVGLSFSIACSGTSSATFIASIYSQQGLERFFPARHSQLCSQVPTRKSSDMLPR